MRRARIRRLALVGAVLAASALGSACTKNKYDSFKVVDYVDATTPASHRFVYTVEQDGQKQVVQGLVEDDFRYKMQLTVGGTAGVEEVVSDDTVAVRFLEPGLVDRFVDAKVEGQIDQKTSIPGASVLDALRAKRWVIDTGGAPTVVVAPPLDEGDDAKTGKTDFEATNDPIFDARTALTYVRGVAQSSYFARYDPESLEPTYRADEDPFPAPKDSSGVVRYDSITFDLPAASQATQGTSSLFPGAVNFRKMAVYVKGGRIIEVREFIGLTPRTLRKFTEYMQALVEQTAPDDVIKSFNASIASLESQPDQLGQFLLQGLNTFIAQTGRPPVRFRTMSLQLQDFGAPDIKVALPTDGLITGNLAVLKNMGRKPVANPDEAKPPSGVQTAGSASGVIGGTPSTTSGAAGG